MGKNREILNYHADKVIAFWKARLLKFGDEIPKESNYVGDQLMLILKDIILAYNNGNSQLEDELRIQVKNIIFAAVETTSVVTSSVLFMLGTHPDLQEKVYNEMIEVLGDGEPDLAKLSELHYLERFMKETLRLYPVAPFIERNLTEEAKLENYLLPAGCNVTIAIYHLHRDPKVFPDPETFDPDRFLPENCKDRHPYAYIPFSAGARNCIGQAYAMMTMKTMLCGIVRNFRIEAARTRSQLKTKFRLLLYPDGGHPVRLYKRIKSNTAQHSP